jgi:hypothetical protein
MLFALLPPPVVAVAQRFEQSNRGVVSFRLHRVFDVHAGPRSRHDDIVFDGVYVNGRVAKVHIISYAIGGKQADAEQQAQLEQDWEHPKPIDVFHAPFDPKYTSEYRYRLGANGTIHFTPLLADGSHGAGVLTYDRHYNLLWYTYDPSVMPEHATSGTITDQRGAVLTNYWAVTHEMQQYQGRYALWNGAATVEVTWSSFRRFANLLQAVESITHNP